MCHSIFDLLIINIEMSFYSPTYLYFLFIVPFVFVLAWMHNTARVKAREKFADSNLFERIAESEPLSRAYTRAAIIAIALVVLIVALARPQGGEKITEEEVEGIDIILAVDVSRSMNATDLTPNRLSAIKAVTGDFIESSYGDRIGVVAFAGDAIVICPLTTDHAAVYDYIARLTTDEPMRPGTGIGNAIEVATNRLKKSDAGRVIILLTDGENNKGIDPLEAVKGAQEEGIKIYTVGIGTSEGAPLPNDTKSLFGEPYRTDAQGNRIMVGLDAETLQKIANETGGKFFHVTNQNELKTLYSSITHEGEKQFTMRRIVRRDEVAPILMVLACILLVMESLFTYVTPSVVKPKAIRSYGKVAQRLSGT